MFVINGKEYPFPDNLTLGEEAEIERITGQGYNMEGHLGALGILALAYVAVKRVDPTVRVQDIELLTESDIDFKGGDEPKVSPLAEAGSSANAEPTLAPGEPDSESEG
jgi:hypothetical protein